MRLQKLEQKVDKMGQENMDHRDNFREINTKYQTIVIILLYFYQIKNYAGQIEELKEQNAGLTKKQKMLGNEVKKQRNEIEKLGGENKEYRAKIQNLRQLFENSKILDKLKGVV